MITIASLTLVVFGCYIFSYAFRDGGRIIVSVVVGVMLITLGLIIFPEDREVARPAPNVRR